jgi:nitrate/TMAO reductase-like tetraheme cytochrome c subunit
MDPRIQIRPPRIWTVILFLGLVLLVFALAASFASPAQAAPVVFQGDKPTNDFCLACHQQEGVDLKLGSDSLPVTINPTEFGLSVHSEEGVACVDCHTNISEYPHPDVKAQSKHDFSITLVDSCKGCHADQYTKVQDSVHQKAFNEDKVNTPLCSDCHNPHTQGRLIGQNSGQLSIAARKDVPETCAQCHADVFDQYKNSVHGQALLKDGNTDVPTCTDCHGVHNISDPTTAAFHNNTPELCAKCHADPAIMDKYGISTNVLNSYVADFHGTTVTLFEKEFPGQQTNKAVCTDCHGVHDIAKVDTPETGLALRQNLLVKCQRCHPDATANFSAAWMSHYEPSPEHYPIVYYVNLFYKIFIPAVIGGMVFFILTDIYRRIVNNSKKGAKRS